MRLNTKTLFFRLDMNKDSHRYREFLEKLGTLTLKNIGELVDYEKDEFIADNELLMIIDRVRNNTYTIPVFSSFINIVNVYSEIPHTKSDTLFVT